MADTLSKIQQLIAAHQVRVSEHGYDELASDGLTAQETIAGVRNAVIVEDYPSYPKGPSVLALQSDEEGRPIHVVWGIPEGHNTPAVLVTAYRPDEDRWNKTFTERKT